MADVGDKTTMMRGLTELVSMELIVQYPSFELTTLDNDVT
jgi:hypothetical protein